MESLAAVLLPLLVGFALNEWSHRRRDRRAEASALDASHRARQVEVLCELREAVLDYGEIADAHLWVGWSDQQDDAKHDGVDAELSELFDAQEELAMRLFSVCAEVDDPWIRHRIDYLEERARWATVEPGTAYMPDRVTKTSVEIVSDSSQDIRRRVILISNLIGERLLALTGGRRLPEWPEDAGDNRGLMSATGKLSRWRSVLRLLRQT